MASWLDAVQCAPFSPVTWAGLEPGTSYGKVLTRAPSHRSSKTTLNTDGVVKLDPSVPGLPPAVGSQYSLTTFGAMDSFY